MGLHNRVCMQHPIDIIIRVYDVNFPRIIIMFSMKLIAVQQYGDNYGEHNTISTKLKSMILNA